MSKSFKCMFLAAVALYVTAFCACSDKSAKQPEHTGLSVAVAPEFAAIIQALAQDYSKKFNTVVDVKILETEKLWSMGESSDFLIGVEREQAATALSKGNSGWRAVLWTRDDIVLAVRNAEVFGVRKARDLQQPVINPVALPSQRDEIGRHAAPLFDYWKVREILQPRIRVTPDSASALKMLKEGQVRAAIVPAHLVKNDPAIKRIFSFSQSAHQSIRKATLRCPRSVGIAAADEFERMLDAEGMAAMQQAGYKATDTEF